MAKKYKGPKKDDCRLIYATRPMEFRAFVDDEGALEIWCFVDGYEAGELRNHISKDQLAGLRSMFKEWDAAGK
jgi:hypothetical protein